jgi:hypothetical protein
LAADRSHRGGRAAYLEQLVRKCASFSTSVVIDDASGWDKRLLIRVDDRMYAAAYPEGDSPRFGTDLTTGICYNDPTFVGPRDGRSLVENAIALSMTNIRSHTPGDALREFGRIIPCAKIQLNTTTYRTRKNAAKRVAMRKTVVAAWCRAFGVPAPDDDTLKAAKAGDMSSAKDMVRLTEHALRDPKRQRQWFDEAGWDRQQPVLKNIDLTNSILNRVSFGGINISNAQCSDSTWVGVCIDDLKLTGADLTDATITDGSFRKTRFQKTVTQ